MANTLNEVQAGSNTKAPGGSCGIVLVDDHPMTRFGARHAIEAEPGMNLLGEAEDPRTALEMIEKLQPRVVVVDLVFAHGTGLDLIKDVRIRCPECAMVVYSAMEGVDYPEQCLRLGAVGFVCKSESMGNLIEAIRAARDGRVYVSEARTNHLLCGMMHKATQTVPSPIERLSTGEFAVLHLIAQGLSNQDIASTLHRSVKTIETYRSRIKKKFGIANATQLAQFAAEQTRAPASSATATCTAERFGPPPQRDSAQRCPIVLIVEDHAATRDPLMKLMRHRGYEVRAVSDGQQALIELQGGHVDLMVLDLMIPRMTGVALLEHIRNDSRWSVLPVIVVTGMSDCSTLRRVRDLADEILIKADFDVDVLFDRMASLLSTLC